MFIFVSLILRYHIHREGKHCDLNHKENHKDFQIDNDSFYHSNDITEGLHNSHEEECLDEAHNCDENHDNLGGKLPSSNVNLTPDIVVT